ncbi:MAG: low molecular weight phosphatase family protein [Methanomethylophilus sp.]|jgi:arsenate reductase
MLGSNKPEKKYSVLFVDSKNDLSSQLAEYYTRKMFPAIYEVYSAGPKHDTVDCDLLSVMYCNGDDLRDQVSKDFGDDRFLPPTDDFDFVVYTERPVYERLAKKSPWQGHQICAHMGTREEFTATDDAELADDLLAMADRVAKWVRENMADPEKLKTLITA